jgi:hypothetical protein
MAPAKTPPAAKTKQQGKKEKIFHPSSRKAGQLTRHAHRKDRLENLTSKRNQKHNLLGTMVCKIIDIILTPKQSMYMDFSITQYQRMGF